VQGHATRKVPSIPNYTTISRRINKLHIKINDDNKIKKFQDKYVVITIDSTGSRLQTKANN
jgi:hydrogenase maturation factor HypE